MNDFIYAAGYYPKMHDSNDWQTDLKRMKECGINVIRTAELFNSWDQIEPKKNEFHFEFLDDFFDLCYEYGIKILLGTGTASPPIWMKEAYPDVNILNNHGESYPNNVSYTWACISNPGYLNEAERYITTLVNRYKNHPALFAYQIHNEIGFPFMPLREGDIDIYCYCQHCMEKFRYYVRDKYENLDELNHAYRWGATNTCHTSWEQVEPPKAKPISWSSVTRWLDWRLFWMDNYVDFVRWQNDLIKSLDSEHVTTTNIFFLKSQDPLGVLTALDQFKMAEAVDIIGYDLYPGSGDKLEKRPEFSSMFLDMARSTARPLDKPFWLLETESGPINGWVLGPSRNVKGYDLIRNVFEAIAHDAKLTLYQGWREWDFQPLHWGAIVDLDGQPTERTEAAAKIGKILQEYGNDFINCKHPKGDIAILIAKENAIILNGMGQEAYLIKALRGVYRIFWEKGFAIDFITPEQVINGYANDYRGVYMPFMSWLDKSLASALEGYVKQGGCLIGTARCGMLGENGWYNHCIPSFGLSDVFGVEAIEAYAGSHPNISYQFKNYKGNWHKEVLKLKEGARILARFNNDRPAVVLNKYGEGYGVYFGTHPDVAYLEDSSYLLWDIIDQQLSKAGIKPLIELDYTNRMIKEIDAHYLASDEEGFIFITNYVTKQHPGFFIKGKKKVRIKLNLDKDYLQGKNILTDESILLIREDESIYFETEISENEVTIIKLY